MSWTDERVEQLKKLWSDGLSASQCAAEIGRGITRNAVIGKIHRLGLRQRAKTPIAPRARVAKPARPQQPSRPQRSVCAKPGIMAVSSGLAAVAHGVGVTPRAPRICEPPEPEKAETLIGQEQIVPLSERVTLMELRAEMCRWPIGDPTSVEFRFCGARTPSGGIYCGYHAQVAYQPAKDRRRGRDRTARAARKGERRERIVDCVEAFGGGR